MAAFDRPPTSVRPTTRWPFAANPAKTPYGPKLIETLTDAAEAVELALLTTIKHPG